MLERYWAWNYEIKDLGFWPGEGYKGHNMPVEVVKAADAHATIADLQGQIAVERANKESAVACVDRDVKKISALQQRVAQLEGEKQEYMQAATNEPLNEPLTYGALKAARFVAKRAFQELVKARADHASCARVLGLVQALPHLPVTAHNGKWYVRLGAYFCTISEAEGMAFHAFEQYRASLPAQRAKLAQGGAGE